MSADELLDLIIFKAKASAVLVFCEPEKLNDFTEAGITTRHVKPETEANTLRNLDGR